MTYITFFDDDDRKRIDQIINAIKQEISNLEQMLAKAPDPRTGFRAVDSFFEQMIAEHKSQLRKSLSLHKGDLQIFTRLRPLLDNPNTPSDSPGCAVDTRDRQSVDTRDRRSTGRMDRDRLDRLTRQSKCCKSGRLETRDLAEGGFLIRVMDLLPDEVTGDRLIPGNVQKGRWWYISPHATDSEVVQTVWLAWKTFHEHELRERFTFYGVPIYHPHQDVERLVDFVATSPRDLRDNTPAKR